MVLTRDLYTERGLLLATSGRPLTSRRWTRSAIFIGDPIKGCVSRGRVRPTYRAVKAAPPSGASLARAALFGWERQWGMSHWRGGRWMALGLGGRVTRASEKREGDGRRGE
jgi:hypothetical protein